MVVHAKFPKSVKFSENLAVVRPFDILDSPKSVSGTIPMSIWSPPPRDQLRRSKSAIVMLQSVSLNDNHVEGTVFVNNISYTKKVSLRYSFDEWSTQQEVSASYHHPVYNSTEDRDLFTFKIEIPNSFRNSSQLNVSHVLQFAIHYEVAGSSHWDNNLGSNYKVFITPNVQANISEYEWSIVSNVVQAPKLLSGLSRLVHSLGKAPYLEDTRGSSIDGQVDENGFSVVIKPRASIQLYAPKKSNFGIPTSLSQGALPAKPKTLKPIPKKSPSPPQRVSTYIPFFDLPMPCNSRSSTNLNLIPESPLPVSFFDSIPLKGPLSSPLVNSAT